MTTRDVVVAAYARRGVMPAVGSMVSGSVWYHGKEAGLPSPFRQSDVGGAGLAAWFLPPEDIDALTARLFNIWTAPSTTPGALIPQEDDRDIQFIKALKKHLQGKTMHVPGLQYASPYKGYSGSWADCPVYAFRGYRAYDLDDDAGVLVFLRLFLAGAHFVLWRENEHHNVIRSVKASGARAHCARPAKHSHYIQSEQATTYPNILVWPPPAPCPIICAILADALRLSGSDRPVGYFMQLEGWPFNVGGQSAAKTKHAADFGQHVSTLWNISTFGMSPYSEKRGTSVFITQNGVVDKPGFASTFKSDYGSYLTRWNWVIGGADING